METTQIVWIFGTSGAGKGTIINKLTSSKREWQFLIKNLGLNKSIVKSNESLKVDDRDSNKVKTEIINLVQQRYITVLTKVQWSDIEERSIPKELKHEIPENIHRIIMLYVNPSKTVERLKDDQRPNRRVSDEDGARSYLKRMTGYVVDLQKEGFQVTWIDSNDFDYRVLSQSEIGTILNSI